MCAWFFRQRLDLRWIQICLFLAAGESQLCKAQLCKAQCVKPVVKGRIQWNELQVLSGFGCWIR
jgi:hypothetical protein